MPAARSSSRSTSGTSSTTSAATISTARSSARSCRCSGRRASTSPRAPAGTRTASSQRWTWRSPGGHPHLHRALNAFLGGLVAEHPHPVRGEAAEDPLRHAAGDRPPTLRAVHERLARRALRALHRAAPARDVRLRRHADRDPVRARGRSASADASVVQVRPLGVLTCTALALSLTGAAATARTDDGPPSGKPVAGSSVHGVPGRQLVACRHHGVAAPPAQPAVAGADVDAA